jgi:hypothetical protein
MHLFGKDLAPIEGSDELDGRHFFSSIISTLKSLMPVISSSNLSSSTDLAPFCDDVGAKDTFDDLGA